jgi:hypothetical protein
MGIGIILLIVAVALSILLWISREPRASGPSSAAGASSAPKRVLRRPWQMLIGLAVIGGVAWIAWKMQMPVTPPAVELTAAIRSAFPSPPTRITDSAGILRCQEIRGLSIISVTRNRKATLERVHADGSIVRQNPKVKWNVEVKATCRMQSLVFTSRPLRFVVFENVPDGRETMRYLAMQSTESMLRN